MKFRFTPKYRRDYKKLEKNEQDDVFEARETIARALKGDTECYYKHRIKEMEGFPDIWEGHVKINLVFTFHYEEDENGEKICWFRRVGSHKIYKKP